MQLLRESKTVVTTTGTRFKEPNINDTKESIYHLLAQMYELISIRVDRWVCVSLYFCIYACVCTFPSLILLAEVDVEAYFKTKQIALWHFHFQNVSVNCFVKSNIIAISLNHYSSKQCFPFKKALLFTTKFCWFISFTVPKVAILQSVMITWLDLMLQSLNFFLKMRSELRGCIVLTMGGDKNTNNTEITYLCK